MQVLVSSGFFPDSEAEEDVRKAIDYMAAMDILIKHETDVLKIAAQLSRQPNHHLFDTYCHALVIFHDGVFANSDSAYYYWKAELSEKVKLTKDWKLLIKLD